MSKTHVKSKKNSENANLENAYVVLVNLEKKTSEELKQGILSILESNNPAFANKPEDYVKSLPTEIYESQKTETEKVCHLLIMQTFPEEREQLASILNKLISTAVNAANNAIDDESNHILKEEVNFLEKIAERVKPQNINDAISLYRFILTLVPFYGPTWINLAICYQEMELNDIAEQIYEVALQLNPLDSLLHIYAAEFFIIIEKRERAQEILMQVKDRLTKESKEQTNLYLKASQMLTYLEGNRG